LEKLLATDLFRIEQEPAVRHSLKHYRDGKAGFPDYLIGEIGRVAGCRDTVSFDRALRAAPGFQILE
jgi:predicted nucleic-acid-binding protein